ncbi:S-layer homology domain-containing protein [Agathobaculum sp. NTUH-O15-33]|uniref:S-layer homology domain-containing protein n=1 Tax=Agathobaculum sp. NTUH-O15-33 TaxID=3079302 RepID=UPI002958734C|nr:S-layer homology domain-containing protein [Agathobaculum sp. NTUH-O15-33]WNX83773.1 S-layer homology domain-containing protein [Agathobaculum sp. NTUH-O15-33]
MKKRLSSIFLICVMVLTMANPAALAVEAELETNPLSQGREAGERKFQASEVDMKRSTANTANQNQVLNAAQYPPTRNDTAVTLDLAAGAIIIETTGYRQGDAYQTYTGSYRLTTKGETANTITVESGTHELILDGVKIKAIDAPAISIEKDASAVITLHGENELTGGPCYAGLHVEVGADVTIDGDGRLIAQGGIVESKSVGTGAGAGIGGNGAQIKDSQVQKWCDFGDITIKGGTIDATGGATHSANYGAGAGIGGGGSTLNQGKLEDLAELEGSITIENGTITASGGADSKGDTWGGAGIGSGGAGNTNQPHRSDIKVTIEGGTVAAKGGSIAAGIGGSNSMDGGRIAITGGQVKAIGSADGYWGGAGIGGGDNSGVKEIKIAGNAQVTAKGGGCAAGIGGGTDRGVDIIQDNASVQPGSITIGGSAIVTAYGAGNGSFGGAGIGAGNSYYNDNGCGTISISDSAKVTAFAGTRAQGIGVGADYGGDDENRLSVSGGVQVWMFNRDTTWPAFWGQNKAGDGITDAYTGNGVATVWYTGSAIPPVDTISDAYSTASGESYKWSHNAARELQILSDGAVVQKGAYPDGFTLGNWAAIFSAETHEVTASVSGAGGTVSPASQSVASGGEAVFTIAREPGYKVDKILVDGADKSEQLDGNTFTLSNVQNNAAISISFTEMTAQDVVDTTDKLPPIKDGEEITEQTKQTILDTKMDYEALSEEEKAAMPETQKEKLHEALSQMSNIEVKVEVQIAGGEQGVFSVPEHQKPALLENMTIEEAAALKSDAAAYKIVVTVAEAKLDAAAESSIQGELNGATAAEKHDVTVKKVMSKNGTDEKTEPISTLVKPIQLEFSIPENLRTPPPQTERTFMLLRTHDQGSGAYTTQVLDGTVDRERWTYVVESDKFSVYTLAYVDTKQDIPTVTAQPSANVTYGTPVTLTVSPTGSGWTYVWYKDANGNGTLDLDTDIKMDGNTSSLTLNDVADSGTYWAQVNTGSDSTVSTAVAVTIHKATPTLSFVPSAESLKGGGSVTLTVGQVPGGGSVAVSCDNSIVVTQNDDGTYSASLPNSNQTYTFTAAYAGDENHNAGTATCTVRVTESGGSSSGSGHRYTVSAGSAQNGAVQVSPENAAKGATVTVRVKPDAGYRLADLTATDSSGNGLKMTDQGGGIFTFAMPGSKVRVQASFVPENAPESELPFVDVDRSDWFYQAVTYVYREGVMSGTTGTIFQPAAPTTRGMIATILHRLEGAPAAAAAAFGDVAAGQYYTDAVAWAAGKGIVMGYGDGSFGPNDPITREQLAAILYRFAGYKGYDVSSTDSLSGFSDSASVSGYAVKAMGWAVQTGLISGMNDGTLRPKDSATRAQAATILTRFMENTNK